MVSKAHHEYCVKYISTILKSSGIPFSRRIKSCFLYVDRNTDGYVSSPMQQNGFSVQTTVQVKYISLHIIRAFLVYQYIYFSTSSQTASHETLIKYGSNENGISTFSIASFTLHL